MSYRGTGMAVTDPNHPVSFAVCDRCGQWRNHDDLVWQYDYVGNQLFNLRILVCKEVARCNDRPFEFYRPIIIPPDPYPTKDPRPEPFALDYGPTPVPGYFTLDQSLLDGPDVLAPSGPPPTGEFELDVSQLDGPDVLG